MDALKSHFEQTQRPPVIRVTSSRRPEWILIHIWDNGPGISQENREKVFDPFFTTKEVGKGTGLGLSICYRIVEHAGGRLILNSEFGQFCEFVIELPDLSGQK